MRKTSYVLTFLAVAATFALNILSLQLPSWLVVRYPEVLNTKVTVWYGLTQRCTLRDVRLPSPDGGQVVYSNYKCQPFPLLEEDRCEKENRIFCTEWTSAGYVLDLSVGFAAVALVTILFGVSTHSRRRRIWRAVAGLVGIHAMLQLVTFGVITDLYRTSRYPPFEHATVDIAWGVNLVSWVLAFLVMVTVIITGTSADRGHHWAAGNRAYQPISG